MSEGTHLLKELLRIIDDVPEGVIVKPTQLRCAAQQLHQAGDDKGLERWPSAAGEHKACYVQGHMVVHKVNPNKQLAINHGQWPAAPVQITKEVVAHVQLDRHAAGYKKVEIEQDRMERNRVASTVCACSSVVLQCHGLRT
jgi:hypothetical protein